MSNRITAIYTDDTKPRRYVSSTSRRDGVCDSNLLAELTTDPKQAHDFGSMTNARIIIPKIHNPYDREFKSISLEADSKPVPQFITGDIN